jgi:N utilization substance protein B
VAARSKARKRALDVLFEAELRGLPVLGLLTERMSLGEQPTPEYAAEIVRGVAAHRDRIDDLIADNAVDWTLERMPAVDRNVLRIGVWELLWADDVPDGVAISEAVAMAQDLSTDGSPAFVNGLLAKVKNLKPGMAAAEDEAARDDEAAVRGEAALRGEAAGDEAPTQDEVATEGEAAAKDEAAASGEAAGDELAQGLETPSEDKSAPAPASRPARSGRSGRGLVKPPRIAVRPDSRSDDSY